MTENIQKGLSLFQLTAARRRLVSVREKTLNLSFVSTHSRPKAAGILACQKMGEPSVSTHSRPKAAGRRLIHPLKMLDVSTHSRPKAAGSKKQNALKRSKSFNSQPPEGGWTSRVVAMILDNVSTHSRPKAAGDPDGNPNPDPNVSTHSRPKAAG